MLEIDLIRFKYQLSRTQFKFKIKFKPRSSLKNIVKTKYNTHVYIYYTW